MIRTLQVKSSGTREEADGWNRIPEYLVDETGFFWLDIQNEPVEQVSDLFQNVFHFHPLAIEDALVQIHVPKIDDWSDYVYIVLHSITFDQSEDDLLGSQELDIFLGPNYLVTYHTEDFASIDKSWQNSLRDERIFQRGVGGLLYQVMEEIAAGYMQVIDRLDDLIETIEQDIFSDPKSTLLETLFTTKRSLLTLRRILTPQREVVNKLARGDFAVVKQKDRLYYRDVYDHYVRLHDISESMRDLLGGALETYLSVVNNRLNDIMKTLTIITTFLMPISFIASFFGMNFFTAPPEFASITGPVGFAVALILLAGTPVFMFFWLRKKKWL
ncbi:MAG: magnesium/cobalt transporter CorA [Chloroflexi bacterium]|nr:magnesium/cobalt transporter CorA [Chloroflexota bacterium]